MANETTVTIKGLKELDDLLKQLPAEIEAKIARGALRAGQGVIANAARNILVSNGNVRTGELYRSVKIVFSRKEIEKYGWMRARLVAGSKKAWYAHIIEFGSASYYQGKGRTVGKPYLISAKDNEGKRYGIKEKRNINKYGDAGAMKFQGHFSASVIHPGVRPQPFMRPALDAYGEQALGAFADYVRVRLPKEIKRLRKK